MSSPSNKVYFPHLDGIRLICFLLVFFFHCYKTVFVYVRNGNPLEQSFYNATAFLFQNGELGVNFFFVLSGFLITYLLIKEQSYTGTIHLGKFYIRRILRIWPLFFLCVAIGFIGIPLIKSVIGIPHSEIARPIYYILLINNFDYISSWPAFPDALILIVLWSVAVEEQFYLAWPLLLKFTSRVAWKFLFIAIIIITWVFRSFYTDHSPHSEAVRNFHTLAVIGDMAIGALLAAGCSYATSFLKFIKNIPKPAIIAWYILTMIVFLFRKPLLEQHAVTLMFERTIIAILFAGIIAEQCFASHSFFKFGHFSRLSKGGTYTYALYCLHFFVISIIVSIFKALHFNLQSITISIFITLVALAATFLLSILSYQYFEKPFLKLKDKFAIIRKN